MGVIKMSTLEREELRQRIKGMEHEEQVMAIRCFPSDILCEEIRRRTESSESIIRNVHLALKGG